MIVRIGRALYQTDFTLEDLRLFEEHGSWDGGVGGVGGDNLIATKINNGAKWCYENRHFTEHHHAGSNCALVEVDIVDYR